MYVCSYCMLYFVALFLNFTLEQYNVMESEDYVEIGVMFLGGTSNTPITLIVTPIEQSALGRYTIHLHLLQ